MNDHQPSPGIQRRFRRWLFLMGLIGASFVVRQKIEQCLQESKDLQAALTHVSIAWQHVVAVIFDQTEWIEQATLSLLYSLKSRVVEFLQSAAAAAATTSLLVSRPQQGQTTVIAIGLGLVGAAFFLWHRRRRSTSSSTNVKHGGDDGMEILRNTRERASTFDFFGTHSTGIRERSGSIGDLSRGEMGDFRRERVGSMDLFYSQRSMMIGDATAGTDASSGRNHHRRRHPKQKQKVPRAKTKATSNHGGPKRKLSFATTPSHSDIGDINMTRDAFFAQQVFRKSGGGEESSEDEEGYLFDEFGLVTLSYEIVYYGPARTALHYETWTPPTSWTEVSRRIIPQEIMLKLRRNLLLDMNEGKVTVNEPKSSGRWDFSLPAKDLSIYVEPPVAGAVMKLYVKGTPKEEWMEHTFASAQMAAQFQLDLLAYQVLGGTLNNLYQVLSLVHSGSQAYDGPEFVLHHNVADEREQDDTKNADTQRTTTLSGVAWDDAMRALSSIPTIRIALERLWLHHRRPIDEFSSSSKKHTSLEGQKETSDSDSGLLNEEYAGKRLILGPVDFFRLFVPALSETALPQSESNRARMEQLLSWRKRAARAAVLIRAYAMSHRVVNLGWQLRPNSTEDQIRTLNRRLAFDDNDDNNRRDAQARDEIYEASVSRDVLCHVRPFDYFAQIETDRVETRRGLVLSPYQAYALVGAHVFRKPVEDDPDFPLHPSKDPVDALPSLQKLIANNPGVDFFVTSYHRTDTVTVMCFARSLARGIDAHFDNVITRFGTGDKEMRDKKVHMMMQMGQSHSLSFLGMLLVRFLSFLFSLTIKGQESPLSLQARRDRIPFPAIRVASYGQTYHFGGPMQDNDELPKNYVGMNMAFTPKGMPNLVSRFLFTYLNDQMSERVLDFTLVLEGESEDELPERALCTTRMVRVDTGAVAKTPTTNDFRQVGQATGDEPRSVPSEQEGALQIWWQGLATVLATAFRASLVVSGWATGHQNEAAAIALSPRLAEGKIPLQIPRGPSSPRYDVAIEGAIDEVTALLKGVRVPVRRNSLGQMSSPKYSGRLSKVLPEDMVLVPVLETINRHDIKRFLTSSGYNIGMAAVRIVETSGWRGRTFPVNINGCRIELQSGQFFQRGYDRSGNPVFYFATTCRGPWRRNTEATMSAALHRFETALSELCTVKPDTCITLVVLLGHSKLGKNSTDGLGEAEDEESENGDAEEGSECRTAETIKTTALDSHCGESRHYISNPRIPVAEAWQLHSTKEIVEEFISLLFLHYPERISKVLLAKGKGRKTFYATKVAVARAMKHCVASSESRTRITFLQTLSRLRLFIDETELSEAAGGSSPMSDAAFDFC